MAKNLHFCFTGIRSPDHISGPSQTLLIKNFNSLYENFNAAAAAAASDRRSTSESDDESSAATPDFATAVASRRFFFSSPGLSNSIVDSSSSFSVDSTSSSSTPLNRPENEAVSAAGGGGGIAVPTYSPDPFADFRRSMQEMVEAREVRDVRESWDYLHELLMCYLSLNPKSTHKFIVGAFADLLVSLMAPPESNSRKKTFPAGG